MQKVQKGSSLYFLILIANLLISFDIQAAQFSFIYPGGEGDERAAMPYLEAFCDNLKNATGIEFSGQYINDVATATSVLDAGQVDVAIVPPDFYEVYTLKYTLNKVAATIPVYASGSYEKYYIVASPKFDGAALGSIKTPVTIISSRSYSNDFIIKKIFAGDAVLGAITWEPEVSTEILSVLKSIAKGERDGVVLLSGYEYSVIKEFMKSKADFKELRLVFASPELESAMVVFPQKSSIPPEKRDGIVSALVAMGNSVSGKVILKNLRLKGFVATPVTQ